MGGGKKGKDVAALLYARFTELWINLHNHFKLKKTDTITQHTQKKLMWQYQKLSEYFKFELKMEENF